MKKKYLVIVLICFLLFICFFFYQKTEKFSYEWVEVKESSIGQYLLFVNNRFGQHVDGTVRLVFINGKTKKVDVSKKGLLYVKSIVSEVRNPRKR